MTTGLNTLLIALHVKIDDHLTGRRRLGRPPKLADAELVTPAVAQALLGFNCTADAPSKASASASPNALTAAIWHNRATGQPIITNRLRPLTELRMKNFKVLRDYRRTASTLPDTASGIANCTTSTSTPDRNTSPTNHNMSYETSLRRVGPNACKHEARVSMIRL